MARVALNMSVGDPSRFDRILAEVKQLGFEVSAAYEDLGVLSGSIDSAALTKLDRIPGLAVERDRTVRAIDHDGT
jgi:hypothetical protein